MRSLAVRVLNDFGVDGIEPQSLGSRKARLALHLLALAGGQVVTSAVLADALWGDTPPRSPTISSPCWSAVSGRCWAGTGSSIVTTDTCCAATGWTPPSWPGSRRKSTGGAVRAT